MAKKKTDKKEDPTNEKVLEKGHESYEDLGLIEKPKSFPEPKKKKPDPKPEPKAHYIPMDWKGVRTVYRCETCQHFEDNEDDMKYHVLRHVPAEDREKLLEELTR